MNRIIIIIATFLLTSLSIMGQKITKTKNSATFYFAKDVVYYDQQMNIISAEAFADSINTGIYGFSANDTTLLNKVYLHKIDRGVNINKKTYIDFSECINMNGENISIGGNDKFSLITLWGTYCIPCIKDLRILNDLAYQFPEMNFYAITNEDKEKVKLFLLKNEGKFDRIKILIGPKKEIQKQINVNLTPVHIIVNKNNEPQDIYIGNLRKVLNTIETLIKDSQSNGEN